MAGYAEAFVRLRVDTALLRKDVETALKEAGAGAGTTAGRRAGQDYGGGFAQAADKPLRDVLGRFTRAAEAEGTSAGRQAGGQYGQGFTQASEPRLRDARGRFISSAAATGRSAGESHGTEFAKAAEPRMRDALGRFAREAETTAGGAGDRSGRSFASRFLAPVNNALSTINRKLSSLPVAKGGLGGALGQAPGLASLAALVPAAGTLGGVGLGAAAGLGGAFVAGGGALAAFGAVAKPVLSDALTAEQAVEKAQQQYNIAIASGTKQATAYKAEQQAISKAYAGMSPQQIALSKQLGDMADKWDKIKASLTPLIASAITPWLGGITTAMGSLGAVVKPTANVIHDLGVQFATLTGSSVFQDFAKWLGQVGSLVVKAGGNTILDLITGMMFLLPKLNPLIVGAANAISRWADSFVQWAASDKATAEIQAFLGWFRANGPAVKTFLEQVGHALAVLVPGLTVGGATELKVLGDFLSFIAKLPKGLAGPLTETVGALLLLAKLPGGTKVINFAVNLVGKGAALLLQGLGLGGKTITAEVGAKQMQTAADTMAGAAEAMQRAADTMAGADVAGAGGGGAVGKAEGAAGAAGAAKAGKLSGTVRDVAGGALASALIVGIIGNILGSIAPQATAAQANKYKNATPGAVQGFLSPVFGGNQQAANVSGFLQKSPLGKMAGPDTEIPNWWSTAYETFQRDVGGKITAWFTTSLPHAVTAVIPRLWSGAYEWFIRSVGSPVAAWFTSSLPHAFTSVIPRLWSGAYEGFMRNVGSPVAGFFTSTLPHLFSGAGALGHAFDVVVGALKASWDWLWGQIKHVVDLIVGGVTASWNWLWGQLKRIGDIIVGGLTASWNWLWGQLKRLTDIIVGALVASWNWLWGQSKRLFDTIVGALTASWNWLWGQLKRITDIIVGAVVASWNWLWTNSKRIIDIIVGALTASWNWLWAQVKRITDIIVGSVTASWNWLWGQTKRIFDLLVGGVRASMDWLWHYLWADFGAKIYNFFVQSLPAWITKAVHLIGQAWSWVGNAIKDPVNWVIKHVINGLIDAFDWIGSHIGLGKKVIPDLGGLSTGGQVPGYGGGDKHLALLEGGEAVIDKERTRQYAWFLKAIGVPGFAGGGLVGGIPGYATGGIIPGPVGNFFAAAGNIVSGFIAKAADIGKITAALASGNTTALANALNAMFGKGTGGAGDSLAQILTQVPKELVQDAVKWLISQYQPPGGGGAGGISTAGVANSSAYAALQSAAAKMGWTGYLWQDLVNLEMREAGFNLNARNPSSGAYGIAQGITGPSWYYGYGGNPYTAAGQATAMVNYIRSRYGNPAAAWAHEVANNWYATGGPIDEPVTGVGRLSGALYHFGENGREWVVPDGQMGRGGGDDMTALLARQNALLERLIAVGEAAPHRTGVAMGDTLNGIARGSTYSAPYGAGSW